jgi:hypothetical protein
MIDTINRFPDDSKVWVYQSDRELTTFEQTLIAHRLADFTKTWTSHSNQLIAESIILHDRLIVLIVDERFSGASGCSIDSSVKFLKQLEMDLGLSLFNRMLVHYFAEEHLYTVSVAEFQELIKAEMVNRDTGVINALVHNYESLENRLVVPAHSTWLSRYFN